MEAKKGTTMLHLDNPLESYSDKELRAFIPQAAKHVEYSYQDIVVELDRRRGQRNSTRSFVLSIVAVVVSTLSVLTSVLITLFLRSKP